MILKITGTDLVESESLLEFEDGTIACVHTGLVRQWTESIRLTDGRTLTTYRTECADCGQCSASAYDYRALSPKFLGRIQGRPQHETRTER